MPAAGGCGGAHQPGPTGDGSCRSEHLCRLVVAHRKLVDVDYYVSLGGFAYGALSRVETDTLSPVFAELAEKFARFVDVLSEVSERSSCSSNADLLRLYERWMKTGSPRSAQLLAERGVVPIPSAKLTIQ